MKDLGFFGEFLESGGPGSGIGGPGGQPRSRAQRAPRLLVVIIIFVVIKNGFHYSYYYWSSSSSLTDLFEDNLGLLGLFHPQPIIPNVLVYAGPTKTIIRK